MMKVRHTLPLASIAAVFLMGLTAADASSNDGSTEKADHPYKATGVVKRCIRLSTTGSPEPLSDELFVFRATDRKLYQNKVSEGCHRADSPFKRIQIEVRSGMICSGELISIVDNGDGITSGFCRLSDFEQVTKNES